MTRKSPFISGIGLIVFTLVGCALFKPSVDNEFVHPEFTYANLASGNVVVGPVTSKVGNEDERRNQYPEWSRLLWSCLDHETKGLHLLPPEFLPVKLDDNYEIMEHRFEQKGQLEDEDLALLQAAFDSTPSYVVAARFVADDISREKNTVKDSAGTVMEVQLDVIRTVKASICVYDVYTGVLSWRGEFTRSKKETNTSNHDPDRGGGWFGNFLYDWLIEGGSGDTYPDGPPFHAVAENIFEDFAKSLPSKD
jgi:hypothetical protein